MNTRMVFIRIIHLSLINFMILSLVGCPKPVAFVVKPENICRGSMVSAEWDATYKTKKDLKLSSSPKVFSDEIVPPKGSKMVKIDSLKLPSSALKVTFVLSGEEIEDRKRDVNVVPVGGSNRQLSFSPDCETGNPKWSMSFDPNLWGKNIKITAVGNMSDREITVSHGGKKQTITKKGHSNHWNGLLFSGEWIIEAKLKSTTNSYESCQPVSPGTVVGTQATHEQPPTLYLVVSYDCK